MALRKWWNNLMNKREDPSGQRGFRETPGPDDQASDIARRVDASTGGVATNRNEPARPGDQDEDGAEPS